MDYSGQLDTLQKRVAEAKSAEEVGVSGPAAAAVVVVETLAQMLSKASTQSATQVLAGWVGRSL